MRRPERPTDHEAAPGDSRPATECTVVVHGLVEGQGWQNPGTRLAIMVLPAPGGPTTSRL
jgi:hypothetical protein